MMKSENRIQTKRKPKPQIREMTMQRGINFPSDEELADGLENLQKVGNKVDFVVTYEPPAKMREFLTASTERNRINTYLNEIFEKIDFNGWFFGKLHINKFIPTKYHAVYDGIVPADNTKIKKKKKSDKKGSNQNG